MDFYNHPKNIKLLQNLLNVGENDSSDTEDDNRLPNAGEVHFSQSKAEKSNVASTSNPTPTSNLIASTGNSSHQDALQQPQTFDEWEKQEALLTSLEFDQRSVPEYRIIYKQSIAPEHIYLQLGNKSSATASCEEMCLQILMPDESVGIDRMQLDVGRDSIELQTPVYHLKLPLVQPIDPDRGKAQWDSERKILRLDLRMKRQYDFVNF